MIKITSVNPARRSFLGAVRWRCYWFLKLIYAGLSVLFCGHAAIVDPLFPAVKLVTDRPLPYKLPNPEPDPHKTPIMNPCPIETRS